MLAALRNLPPDLGPVFATVALAAFVILLECL